MDDDTNKETNDQINNPLFEVVSNETPVEPVASQEIPVDNGIVNNSGVSEVQPNVNVVGNETPVEPVPNQEIPVDNGVVNNPGVSEVQSNANVVGNETPVEPVPSQEIPVDNGVVNNPGLSEVQPNVNVVGNETPVEPVASPEIPVDNGVVNNSGVSEVQPSVNVVGVPVDGAQAQTANYIQPNQGTTNNLSDDEELLKAFIGNNYEKITTKPFNFAGFFFGPCYMFFRKMLGFGILFALISLALSTILEALIPSDVIVLILTLLYDAVLGIFVNKIYVSFARKKVNKIKLDNIDKDVNELKVICARKGGTSVGILLLGILIYFVLIVIVSIVMVFLGIATIASEYIDLFKEDVGTSESSSYQGALSYDTNIKINDEFTIVMPSKFENNSSSYSYEYEYSADQGVFDSCEFSMKVPKGYTDAEDLIKQMAIYNTSTSSINEEKINNITWYTFTSENSFGKTYYYGTLKDNKVYLIEYEVEEDAPSDCEIYRTQIINSIQNK